jgi:hypothetical protein
MMMVIIDGEVCPAVLAVLDIRASHRWAPGSMARRRPRGISRRSSGDEIAVESRSVIRGARSLGICNGRAGRA